MEEIERLKKVKEEFGLSYEDLSKELGASFKTVYNWFKGTYEPSKLALIQIKKFIKKYNSNPIDR